MKKRRRNRHHEKEPRGTVFEAVQAENAVRGNEEGSPSTPLANDLFSMSTLRHDDISRSNLSTGLVAPLGQPPGLSVPESDTVAEPTPDMDTIASFAMPAVYADAPPSLGHRLREGRVARGLTLEDVASRLRLQSRLVQALEADDYSSIEHAIYLKGYLASYARLVDLSPEAIAPALAESRPVPPPLVATGQISHSRYLYERYSVPAVYLLLTGLIVGPSVWLATHGGLDQNITRLTPLDTPAETTIAVPPPPIIAPAVSSTHGGDGDRIGTAAAVPAIKPADQPLMASLAPFSVSTPNIASVEPAASPPGSHQLELKLSQASWVEITAADGRKLEYGLIMAGSSRRYDSAQPLSVRLGNAEGAQVEIDGKPVEIAPFIRANVARFRAFGTDGPVSSAE